LPDFWRLRGGSEHACFFAFDLLMLDGRTGGDGRSLLSAKPGSSGSSAGASECCDVGEHLDDARHRGIRLKACLYRQV
jgi:hypothetical protein